MQRRYWRSHECWEKVREFTDCVQISLSGSPGKTFRVNLGKGWMEADDGQRNIIDCGNVFNFSEQ
eukprot:1394904-Amorphochlora_amoeboformis.AAC.1